MAARKPADTRLAASPHWVQGCGAGYAELKYIRHTALRVTCDRLRRQAGTVAFSRRQFAIRPIRAMRIATASTAGSRRRPAAGSRVRRFARQAVGHAAGSGSARVSMSEHPRVSSSQASSRRRGPPRTPGLDHAQGLTST